MTYAPGWQGMTTPAQYVPASIRINPAGGGVPDYMHFGFSPLQAVGAAFSAAGFAKALQRFAGSLVSLIAPASSRRAAEHILEVANRTVPYDTGALMRSGQVVRGGRRGQWVIEYTEPYAQIQHEALDYRHDYPRRAKWLELTMREQQGFVSGMVGRDIQSSFANNLGGRSVGGRLQGFSGSTFVSGS